MTLHRALRIALLFVTALNGGILFGSRSVRGAEPNDAVPPNYRALIAKYMLTLGLDQRSLHTAMIATPFDKPSGIWGRLTGATEPVVCVSMDTRNMLGQEFKGYFLFYFENGQPHRGNTGGGILANECGTFSPFIEVMKR